MVFQHRDVHALEVTVAALIHPAHPFSLVLGLGKVHIFDYTPFDFVSFCQDIIYRY